MSKAITPSRYVELATRIITGRGALGLTQTSFAAELGLKQQTVSRWEAGTHRPDVDQVPALAALIGENASALMLLAEYGRAPTLSLSSLFPVDALDPDTFEKFVEMLIAELFPDSDVNIQGSRGHTQKGTDVIARFPDGRVWSFQCKRVDRFGKAEIEQAIAYHAVEAVRKFLVLSKVANPVAIEVVAAHKGWTLWDKQVLTRQVRTLPIEVQERLVDIFFRGQRMALLGRCEPGPWLTPEEYFAPFRGRSAIFSHEWSLVGRKDAIAGLVDALGEAKQRFSLLVGPGGIGKTRVLKEAIARFARKNKGIAVRFLSASQEPDAVSLAALGTGRKVLVVDDAHDREGLKLLVEYAVDERNKAKLFIATRPYAEQRIRNELGLYRAVDPVTVRLGRLDKASMRKLVVEVLNEFRGDRDWAEPILEAASDSPLVAAMAARVVAVEGMIPELARGESKLRQFILSRFTHVITGRLGTSADAHLLRAVLEVLALIQPFHIDDRRVAELVEANRPNIHAVDVSRALKLLLDGGVIYKRGALYRLMPDLLGDFLIEESCIGADGRLTLFAENVANQVEGDRLTQVLVNLGRTDWRLAEGEPSNSKLLEPIWRILNAIESEYDGRIDAVQAVAYYQPAQALKFVQAQIEQGRVLAEFGNILERVAYSPEHRQDALRLLWELGQHDDRDLNPHPSHPIRTLADLVGYDRYKPVAFNEDVAEFGFALLDDPDAWKGRYTPFDVLKPLLSGEGMTTRSTGRGISMSPFFVAYDVVAKLRSRLIDRIIDLLEAEDSRTALHAAHLVNDAVRSPHGMLNSVVPDELIAKYEAEFSVTIARIGLLVEKGTLAPTTIMGLIRSLDWYAQYGSGPLHDQVCQIFERLPSDLNFRFHAAVAEGAEWTFVGQVQFASWTEDKDWQTGFVAELLEAFPNRDALCDALLAKLEAVEGAGMSVFPSSQLVDKLIAGDPQVGEAIIGRSLAEPVTRLRNYLGYAVGALLELRPEEGRAMMRQMLASPDQHIRRGGACGLIGLNRAYDAADLELLGDILRASDPLIASIGVAAVRARRDLPARQVVSLLLLANIGRDADLLEAVAAVLCNRTAGILDKLRKTDVSELLKHMKALPRVEGHWARELLLGLGRRHGLLVGQYVLDRADRSLSKEDNERYRTLPYSGRHGGLSLEESPDAAAILKRVWLWLQNHDEARGSARYSIGETVAAMFKLDSAPVIDFLDTMLDRATAGDLRWIGHVLRNSHHRFVFNQRRFVERYLNRCKAVEPKLVNTAVDQLGAAAMSGGWSGTVGEPMPRDVRARDEAAAILATMSRLSSAYALYNAILEDSKRNIERSLAEAAALDDEEG